ncbi:MAG: 3,4-dihydroxy-2-butanone-4-phosphate synthase, partial [Alphaproteobacteria bacterium]
PSSLSDRVRAGVRGDASASGELRDYGVGAQILLDLGVREMILLSNRPKTIIGLDGYGLVAVEHRPLAGAAS